MGNRQWGRGGGSGVPAGLLRIVVLLALPALLAALALVATPARPASAASPVATYQVTLVARQCPSYSDIMANLARNNIQESLQDLGPDSVYAPGQPISPAVETANDPGCTPLPGWQFTLGSGIAGKVNSLSTVSAPGAPITVQPSVPLLDPQGQPTGQTIASATTVTLTQAQVGAALSRNLWIQGGTPSDPLVSGSLGAGYAFGALRCSIDNLNGDNVEWVGFSTGSSQVFCYYYAVHQAPVQGTIIVQKQLGPGESGTTTFDFAGNISYNPGGTFEVPVSGPAPSTGSHPFVRSASPGVTWNFHEIPYPGFTLTSLTCTAPGGSTTTTDLSTGTATVALVPGDTVTCTYVDTAAVTNAITLVKQTSGGFGGPFDFTVTPPSGPATQLSATTTAADAPVSAGTVSDTVLPGTQTYTVAEAVPAPTPAGSWSVSGFECTGAVVDTSDQTSPTQTITLASGAAVDCTYTDLFTPDGSLTITKTTLSGTGSTDFVVNPATSDPDTDTTDTVDPVLTATTTQPGVAVTATQVAGDPLNPLAPGQYSVVEQGPGDSTAGLWTPVSIVCTGAQVEPSSADVLVTITAADPRVTCAFTNTFTADAPVVTPTTTTPTATTAPGSTAAASTAPTSRATGTLAATGTDLQAPLAVGVGLAALGLVLIGFDRNRRSDRLAPVRSRRRPPG